MTHGYAGNLAHGVLLAIDHPDAAAGQIYNCGDDRQFSIRQIVEIIADEMKHKLEVISLPAEAAYPARGVSLEITPHHKLLDLHKIKLQLGYAIRFRPKRRCGAPRDGISSINPIAVATSSSACRIPSTMTPRISSPPSIAKPPDARANSTARPYLLLILIRIPRRRTSPAIIETVRRIEWDVREPPLMGGSLYDLQ